VTFFADWQGKWEDALKDAKMLEGRVGVHQDEAVKECGSMEVILGGVPAGEVMRLLGVCESGCERGAKKEREVFEKMFKRRGNMGMPEDYAGAGEAGKEEDVGDVDDGEKEEAVAGISNVVRRMRTFEPETAREGEGPFVMVEMEGGESKEGRAVRLRDEGREREKTKDAVEKGREKEERERGEREMAKSRDRGVDGDLSPPRNVPCHVSSVYGGSELARVADVKKDVLEREERKRYQESEREGEREREREGERGTYTCSYPVRKQVKSCRAGKLNIKDGFARIDDGRLKLFNCHIARHFTTAEWFNHEEVRARYLLANKAEINKMQKQMGTKGLTLIPLRAYFNENGFIKVPPPLLSLLHYLDTCPSSSSSCPHIHIS